MLVLASSPRTTSRLGASMISLSAPPASIGKRTAPPPMVKLVTRSGDLAARKSAAAVPTSGPTRCGAPRPALVDQAGQKRSGGVRGDQFRATVGVAESRHVDGDRPPDRRDAVPDSTECPQ